MNCWQLWMHMLRVCVSVSVTVCRRLCVCVYAVCLKVFHVMYKWSLVQTRRKCIPVCVYVAFKYICVGIYVCICVCVCVCVCVCMCKLLLFEMKRKEKEWIFFINIICKLMVKLERIIEDVKKDRKKGRGRRERKGKNFC